MQIGLSHKLSVTERVSGVKQVGTSDAQASGCNTLPTTWLRPLVNGNDLFIFRHSCDRLQVDV